MPRHKPPAVTFHYLGEPGELFDGFGSAVDTIRELLKLNLRDTTTKVLASVDPDTGERCLQVYSVNQRVIFIVAQTLEIWRDVSQHPYPDE